jgi:hypothetical protein
VAQPDELALDGNAVAGLLQEIWGGDVTAATGVCAHCGNAAAVGTLVAYVYAPGIVLRCRVCASVVVRAAVTPTGIRVDASGARGLRHP